MVTATRSSARQHLGTADLNEFLLRRCGLSPSVAANLLGSKFLGVPDDPDHSHWHREGGHVPCDFACFIADEFGYSGETMGGAVEALGLAMEAALLELTPELTKEMGLTGHPNPILDINHPQLGSGVSQARPTWSVPNPFQHTLVTELALFDSRDRTPIQVKVVVLPPLSEFARTVYPMEANAEWQGRLPDALAAMYGHLARNSFQGFEPKMGKGGQRSMHFAKTFSKPGHVTTAEAKVTGDSIVGVTIDFVWNVREW